MDIERHSRLTALFAELSGLPPGPARDARLLALCGDDRGLRAELEQLLRFDAEADAPSPGAVLRADMEDAWEREGALLEDRDPGVPGRYQILRLLGQGGFGSVYLAREEEPFPRLVAIKVVKPGMDTREVLARFDSERRALASMDHPGIARAYTAGTDRRGRPYFVMEYVEGQTITAFCDERRLDVRRRLDLFVEVCEAIQHAHFKGIVHRDIKPGNVLVTTVDGRPAPRIIDFGIAKALERGDGGASLMTREGQLVGTLAAMSPEQALGAGVDTRADVYALGGLLYELLCGSPPFPFEADTESLVELRRRVVEEDPPRPSTRARGGSEEQSTAASRRGVSPSALVRSLADDLDWVVMKALEKDPARRYASPSELAADVRRYLASEPLQARPPSRSYQVARFARRHRAGLVVASVMLILLVAGSIGTAIGWRRSLVSLKIAREQESRALRNLERARIAEADALAINAFLNDDLLSAVSPESMGFDVTMRQVLDAAAERVSRIDGRLAWSPAVERAIRTTLGRTYRSLGLTERAMEQLEAALAIEVPSAPAELESSQPRRAEVRARGLALYELGRVHLQENRNAEAEQVLSELWEECSAVLGDDDPLTIDALHFVGVSIAEQERFDEARVAFDATRATALAVFGPNHELAIQSLHSQGLLELSRERDGERDLESATGRLARAVQASRDAHGSDDPRTVRRIIDLARALFEHGELSEALTLCEEAHERSARVQGPMHPTTAAAALALGMCHMRTGSLELASTSMEEALAIATPLGGAHPVLDDVRYMLTVCRMEQRRWGEAEELALAALDSYELLGRPLRRPARLLAEICAGDGRSDEARYWRRIEQESSDGHGDSGGH
jgi:non-specific serine/threonine protein kinase/serine/threonine-protein kinase